MARPDPLQTRIQALTAEHRNLFGDRGPVGIYKAPGRINIIGEHTDYNGGYVLPAAIDISILAAATPRADRTINLKSFNFAEAAAAPLDGLAYDTARGWGNYPLGAAWALEHAGIRLPGADIVFQGDIPLGSGLSSSAAIEVLMMKVMLDLAGNPRIGVRQIPVLCRKGENDFIGVKSGIMDQFVITFGREGRALFLDCATLDYRLIPFVNSSEVVIVAADTRVKRELARSAYNQRVEECATGLDQIGRAHV
jgi:galactokinase